MSPKDLLDFSFLRRGNVCDDEVLVRGEAEVAVVGLGNFTKAGHERVFIGVVDTTVLDEHGVVKVAGVIFDPAIAVAVVLKLEVARLAELEAAELFHFFAEGVDAHALDSVFKSGIRADVAVSKISLNADHSLADKDGLLRGAEPKQVCKAGEGFFIAVRHAHTTTNGDVVANDLIVACKDSDVAKVVSIDIDVVAWRYGDNGLELTRQVEFSVDRLFFIGDVIDLGRIVSDFHFFAGAVINPDVVVGSGAGAEVIRNIRREL